MSLIHFYCQLINISLENTELEDLRAENSRLTELLEEHEAMITELIGHKTNEARERERAKSLLDEIDYAANMISELQSKILDTEKLLTETSAGRVHYFVLRQGLRIYDHFDQKRQLFKTRIRYYSVNLKNCIST